MYRDLFDTVFKLRFLLQDRLDRNEASTAEKKTIELFENTNLAMFRTSRTGELLAVNQAFAELLGCTSPQEFMNLYGHRSIFPNLVRKGGEHPLEAGRSAENVIRFEWRSQKKNGSFFKADLHMIPLRNRRGKLVCIEGFAAEKDSPSRRTIEKSFSKLQNQNELILNSAGEGIFGLDTEGRHTFVNPAAARALGYSVEELMGRHSHATWHYKTADGNHYPEEDCPIYAAYKDGLIHRRDDEVFWRKDGSKFPVEYTSTPVFENGRLTGAVVTFTDISARKAAEKALEHSEAKYRLLFENLNDAAFIAETGTERIIETNRQGEILLELPRGEIAGMRQGEIFANREIEQFLKKVQSGQVTSLSGKNYVLRKDGSTVPVTISAAPLSINNRRLVLILARDITESQRAEEELFRAQKIESIGILAGGLAHDFNNLLTGILGNIGLAKLRINCEPEAKEILSRAENAVLQAKNLTNQLLTFSRGGLPVKHTVYITTLLKEMCAFALRGSNVQCTYDISDDLWPVDADQGQLGQVINNLVINAQEAMPEGGFVSVSARNFYPDGSKNPSLPEMRYVQISVRDHGIGIPEEYLKKIYDPYFTTKQEGRGLGLAVTHSIIEKHGGYIGVVSRPGGGTTFTVYLPAAESMPDEAEVIENGPEVVTPSGKKILLMDDEDIIRSVGSEILRHFGYNVDLAGNGDEALQLYKRAMDSGHGYDMVILDLTIPGGKGGRETIKELQELDPAVKAVVSSGYCDDPVMAQYEENGFKGVIAKPYQIQELRAMLDKIVGS